MVFTPTAHQAAPGSTVTTKFTLGVTDLGGGTASNSATAVVATASTDAPTITGTVGNQGTTDLVAINPFSTATIGELDDGAMPTVTITLRAGGAASDASGHLSGTGLIETSAGIYSLAAASPSALTDELRALTFTPTHDQVPVGQEVATEFDILAAFGAASAMDTTTTVNTKDVPCFCAGTRIATPGGEVPVESLAAGDLVLSASGVARAVRWIGRRTYAERFLRSNAALWPIRIQAGALADNVPVRDLWVSPLHALFLDGHLIPAGELVDGAGITRENVDRVCYFHVELDSHDVLLADGAAAESFLDDGSLGLFHNSASRPVPDVALAGFCAPRITHGLVLEGVRSSLAHRRVKRADPVDGRTETGASPTVNIAELAGVG